MRRAHLSWMLAAIAALAGAAWALGRPTSALPLADGPVDTLIVAGGATPENTEVSLEQDARLALDVLPGNKRVLFGGGAGAFGVRVETEARPLPLEAQVGQLFQPRNGRSSRYRPTTLDTAESASRDAVERALTSALATPSGPLMLFVAAHGEPGQDASDNRFTTWGGHGLTVTRLAQLHEAAPRPLRVVVAACFSGGFQELVFDGALEERGVTGAPRCGLFSGPWDRETTGCDPNPDRRAQEGYSLHFLHALARTDRHGRPLPLESLDLDHDGAVSLLEAHTRARITSRSIDIPTTTSERYLRFAVKDGETASAPLPDSAIPEERAVVAQLGIALGLPTESTVEQRAEALATELDGLSATLADLEHTLDDHYATLAGHLLARWPVLDDAFHPDFRAMVESNREAIETALSTSPEAVAYRAALAAVEAADDRYSDALAREAVVLRLLRAHETLTLAATLKSAGGDRWDAFERLRTCERWVPGG